MYFTFLDIALDKFKIAELWLKNKFNQPLKINIISVTL